MVSSLRISTIQDNTYGYAYSYIRATELQLLSILSQSYYIIIDCGISALGHGIEFIDGINNTYKGFIFHLVVTVKLPGSELFDTYMTVHTATQNSDVSLAQEFQKHLSNVSHKHDILDNVKHKKRLSKNNWTNREYHVQHNKDVGHQGVNMYCVTNQFT